MKLHFCYAGHPGMIERYAPYSITRELYKYFIARVDTRYYDWCTSGLPHIDEDDIWIGHPNYDPQSITQRVFRDAKCRAKCLIFPLHTGIPEHNLPFDHLVAKADCVFNIMGEYWYDTLGESVFAHWEPKIIRVDMAIDGAAHPYLRERFGPPGKRNLLYIGQARPEKNVDYLYEVMKRLPDLHLHWYSGVKEHPLADLPNVSLTGFTDLNEAKVREIIGIADIFINCSKSDANPTTLLEAAAWGFIPMCSKQSGYYADEMFHEVDLQSIDKTIDNIKYLQHLPESRLLEQARSNSERVRSYYTWERFGSTIWNGLSKFM